MDPFKPSPPARRLLCAEPLERRWLLSAALHEPDDHDSDADETEDAVDGDDRDDRDDRDDEDVDEAVVGAPEVESDSPAALPTESSPTPEPVAPVTPVAPVAPVGGDGVELVEWELAPEDEPEEEVAIAVSALPRAVLDAFAELFPGGKAVAGETGVEDGEQEFDVIAEVDGDVLDLTFTPAGELVETERELTTAELPREVLDWVHANFGDAPIEEASVQLEDGVVSYEVKVDGVAGGQDGEANLRVPGAAPPDLPGVADGDDDGGSGGLVPVTALPDASSSQSPGATASAPADAESTEPETARREPAAPPSEPAASVESTSAVQAGAQAGGDDESASDAARVPDLPPSNSAAAAARVAAALQSLVAGAPATAWVPELQGVLDGVFPLDASLVEQRLDELLAEVDALAKRFSLNATNAGFSPSHLAVAAALVAVAQLYFWNARRSGAGPTLVFNASSTTWSWVVGAPTASATKRVSSTFT